MNPKSITAIIVALLALVNLLLSACGVSPLPVDAEGIAAGVSAVAALGAGAVSTWYNFSITTPAKVADSVLAKLKSGEVTAKEVLDLLDNITEATNSDKCEGTD